MKKFLGIISLIIFIFLLLFFYHHFSRRGNIRWQGMNLEIKAMPKIDQENHLQDTLFLNEIHRNYSELEVDDSQKINSYAVDLSSISVISGKMTRRHTYWQLDGEEVVIALRGCKELTKKINANILELSLSNQDHLLINTFAVYGKNSLSNRIREFFREVLRGRYGEFVHQVEMSKNSKFQKIWIDLGSRTFQKKRYAKAIVIKISSKNRKKIKSKLNGVNFLSESSASLESYPKVAYFKHERRWVKSVFLPSQSKLAYEILTEKPAYIDGYLGSFPGIRVDYSLLINGKEVLREDVSGGMEYFKCYAEPEKGSIKFEVISSGIGSIAGILGNITFRVENKKKNEHILYHLMDALRGDFGGVSKELFAGEFREGAIFKNGFSNGTKTADSLPVIFSGKYKFMLVNYQKDSPYLPKNEFLLAEYLKTRGYTTAAFVANPWLVRTNSHQGFDHVYDCWGKIRELPLFPEKEEYVYFKYGKMWEFLQDFLKNNAHKKLFIYLHSIEPHPPYELPAKMREYSNGIKEEVLQSVYGDFEKRLTSPEQDQIAALKALYKDDVVAGYNFSSKLTGLLEESGVINEESLCIFTADHGERFYEHKAWKHGPPDVYNEVLRVPIMMKGRGITPGVYEEKAQLADIFPSVMDWVGDKPMAGLVGDSLLQLTKGKVDAFLSRPIYSDGAVRKFQYSFIKGDIKVIVDGNDVEIYNIAKDPGEKINLNKDKQFRALVKEAKEFRGFFKKIKQDGRRSLSAEERARLKSLGYLD